MPKKKSKYELKTKMTEASVDSFLYSVDNPKRREDSLKVLELMKEITQLEPKMWGKSIVGFGIYHYKYASGHEGDWPPVGFSPRKQALTIYISDGFDKYNSLLKNLGKYKTGKSCLYINKLEDVKLPVLKELIAESFNFLNETTQ